MNSEQKWTVVGADRRDRKLAMLQKMAAESGLTLRPDSYLVTGFINDKHKMSARQVINQLCYLKYLHTHTDYNDILDQLKAEGDCEGDKLVAMKREAKARALRKYPVPKTWPWLEVKDEVPGLESFESLEI